MPATEAGLAWAGLGWAGLGWAGPGCDTLAAEAGPGHGLYVIQTEENVI